MKRIIAIAAVPLLLGGCLPLPVTIASTAISGFSYLTTGKSSTDHVLSAAVDQDCALTRPIIGEAVCRDFTPDSGEETERVVVAAYPGDRDDGNFRTIRDPEIRLGAMKLDEIPQGPAQVAVALPFIGNLRQPIETPGLVASDEVIAPKPVRRPATVSAPIDPWNPPAQMARVQVAKLSVPSDIPAPVPSLVSGERYVVIGSLRDAARAKELAGRFAVRSPEIRRIEIGGQIWNRVVVGPYAPEQARGVKAELGVVDGKEPWIIRLEPSVEQIAMR
ncbi:MAG: SPOR domain-containing protein [Thalassobaculaceae bacterium]|nr:SPOR domain-containing protein [Thalassobaculaceae bacterium]